MWTNPVAMWPLTAAPLRLPNVLPEWHQKIAVAVEGNGPAVGIDKRLGTLWAPECNGRLKRASPFFTTEITCTGDVAIIA